MLHVVKSESNFSLCSSFHPSHAFYSTTQRYNSTLYPNENTISFLVFCFFFFTLFFSSIIFTNTQLHCCKHISEMQHLLQKESRPRSPDVSGLKISFPARSSLRGLLGNRQWKRLLNNERQNRYRISWAKNHGPRQWPFSRIASPRCILRQFLVVLNNPRENSS